MLSVTDGDGLSHLIGEDRCGCDEFGLDLLSALGIGARAGQMRPGCFRRPSNLERFTDKTIVSLTELRRDLKLARKRGFAFDDEERKTGRECVVVPTLNAHGDTVALPVETGINVAGVVGYASR
jgi:hypothetical protein